MVQSVAPVSSKTLTFEEYLVYEGEPDVLYELFRGHLIPMPAPRSKHARICLFLVYQLQRYFALKNLPFVAVTTVGVRTEEASSRIPDVVVCSQSLWEQICDRPSSSVLDFEETPRLVIEVTSDNWRDDYIRKRAEYDFRDIPEYWIVDANKSRIRICSYPENENTYEHKDLLPGEQMQCVQFADLVLPVDLVLSPPIVEDLIRAEEAKRQQLEERAQRLAQKLQEMGIDPNSV
ncbi:MAG: Uma2 family endonuclease [Oscillatoria sp. SIO1A7]|nr:Uma2 family endonuclease [Oscillatoria sp. SIO1A7]